MSRALFSSAQGPRVLVTGATGFLGGWVCRRLVREGWRVTGFGRNKGVGATLEAAGIRFVAGDLAKREAVLAACAGQDFVVHCGALSAPWGRYSDFFDANVVGTENVIEGCESAPVRRLVHISTPSIYISKEDRLGISESDPLPRRTINDYAKTKKMGEERIDQAFARGLKVVTLRPQGIFGPGDRAIMPRLIRAAERGVLPVIGDGRTQIDLTYVENVVDAILLSLASDEKVLGKKYNITNGEPVELYSTLAGVLRTLGVRYRQKRISFKNAYRIAGAMEFCWRAFLGSAEPALTRYAVCVLGRSRTLSIDAARRDLGYWPRITTGEGISKFVQSWMMEKGMAGPEAGAECRSN